MSRHFDHIDLRVSNLSNVREFYEALLHALGFTKRVDIPGWLQYEAVDLDGVPGEFFGVTESVRHLPNENRIAFWVESPKQLERLAELVRQAGALNLEGPMWEGSTYYAAYFEDPSGNRLELCYRSA
jgi:catechol 2,3-dioxygenase-like lactoylglutathione lyase family enzyme